MNAKKIISPKRQAQLDAITNSEIAVGEKVYVRDRDFFGFGRSGELLYVTVDEIAPDCSKYLLKKDKTKTWVDANLIVARDLRNAGANPFNIRDVNCRVVAFTLQSILFGLNILEEETDEKLIFRINDTPVKGLNWNPFVFDKDGNKVHYQRGFVWSLHDKQLLVDSIYNGLDCGKIVTRKRGWDELVALAKKGETEFFFHDIVDGKQRLDAVRGFIMGEYADLHGNYYGDLSAVAQNKFTENQYFSYGEMPDESKDEDVIYQFLRMNFSGVQMSKEHLDYVKSINV